MAIRERRKGYQIDVQLTRKGETLRHREQWQGDRQSAEAREAQIRADLLAGRPVSESPSASATARSASAGGLTLSAAFKHTWARYWERGGNAKRTASAMRLAEEEFGPDTLLTNITTEMIEAYVSKMIEAGLAPSSINNRMNCVRKTLRYYHARGKLPSMPVIELPSIGQNNRTRLLSDHERAEIVRFYAEDFDGSHRKTTLVPGRDLADLFVLLQDTGARPSELRKCRPQDLHGRTLAVLFTKTDNPRHIPLTSRAIEAWERQRLRHPEERPFEWATEDRIGKCWKPCRAHLGMQDDPEFVPYLMRHDCATRLYAKTRDLLLVKKWMGHRTTEITEGYAKLFPTELEAARDLMEEPSTPALQAVA